VVPGTKYFSHEWIERHFLSHACDTPPWSEILLCCRQMLSARSWNHNLHASRTCVCCRLVLDVNVVLEWSESHGFLLGSSSGSSRGSWSVTGSSSGFAQWSKVCVWQWSPPGLREGSFKFLALCWDLAISLGLLSCLDLHLDSSMTHARARATAPIWWKEGNSPS